MVYFMKEFNDLGKGGGRSREKKEKREKIHLGGQKKRVTKNCFKIETEKAGILTYFFPGTHLPGKGKKKKFFCPWAKGEGEIGRHFKNLHFFRKD